MDLDCKACAANMSEIEDNGGPELQVCEAQYQRRFVLSGSLIHTVVVVVVV